MTHLADSHKPMLFVLALALLALLASVPGAAQEPSPPGEHVVRRGDTLWDLAGHYLANPFLWPMIYEANRAVVEDPHWIYPGERLRIPGVPGEVVAQPGAQPAGEPAQAAVAEVTDQAQAADSAQRAGVAVTLDLRRPVIPAAGYYSTPWLESAVSGRTAGQVQRLADQPSAATDKIAPTLHPHDRILMSRSGPAVAVGDSLLIVRLGRELIGYGQVVEPLAMVRVDSLGENVFTGRLVVQYDEARVGDQVVRFERMPEIPLGRPSAVPNGPEGRLIEFLVDRQIYGTGDHGFVVMSGEQLRLGDELAVYVPGGRLEPEAGQVVPPTEVARATVVRLSERSATVRLTGVFDTSVRGGLPVRLVARTP